MARSGIDLSTAIPGDFSFVEIRRVETHLLRDCIDERVDANLDRFSKTSLAEWTTHAVVHFTEHAIRQLRLNAARVLSERRLRRCGEDEQQTIAAGYL